MTSNTKTMNKTTANSTSAPQAAVINVAHLQERAKALRLMGLLAHWDGLQGDPERLKWTADLLDWEESERSRRSLERRLRSAHIGRFKPLADFDWDWPKHCDRAAVQELMTLSFMAEATNVVLVGPNGVGKSMLACNLGHQALIEGRTVLLPLRVSCWETWLRWTVTRHCAGVFAITQRRTCYLSMRWVTCRIPTGTPICCSS
jgi:DNA replication protein DnaC